MAAGDEPPGDTMMLSLYVIHPESDRRGLLIAAVLSGVIGAILIGLAPAKRSIMPFNGELGLRQP